MTILKKIIFLCLVLSFFLTNTPVTAVAMHDHHALDSAAPQSNASTAASTKDCAHQHKCCNSLAQFILPSMQLQIGLTLLYKFHIRTSDALITGPTLDGPFRPPRLS